MRGEKHRLLFSLAAELKADRQQYIIILRCNCTLEGMPGR
jgi:hypothetical protein